MAMLSCLVFRKAPGSNDKGVVEEYLELHDMCFCKGFIALKSYLKSLCKCRGSTECCVIISIMVHVRARLFICVTEM